MTRRDLVIGMNSLLGTRLLRELSARRSRAVATTRHRSLRLRSSVRILELSKSIPGWVKQERFSCAFLCAAVTGIREIENNPRYAGHINVNRTVELAETLMSQGAFVVYPSSTAVFPASSGPADESTAACPETAYGRLKAEAEEKLLRLARQFPTPAGVAIVRIAKVVSSAREPFQGWLAALSTGRSIQPYSDVELAPVSLAYAVNGLLAAAQSRRTGIYHLSGATAMTYAQFAVLLAEVLGVDSSLVAPTPMPRYAGGGHPYRAVRAALDMPETSRLLGIFPQQPRDVAEDLVREYRGA